MTEDPLDAVAETPARKRPVKRRKKAKAEPKGPRIEVVKRGPANDLLDRLAAPQPTRVIQFVPGDMPAEIAGRSKLYGNRNAQRELILMLTGNGLEPILHALSVMRGEKTSVEVNKFGDLIEVPPSLKDQAEARRFLAEYSMSAMKQQVDVNVKAEKPDEALDVQALSTDELRQFLELKRKMRKRAESPVAPLAIDPGPIVDAEIEPAS